MKINKERSSENSTNSDLFGFQMKYVISFILCVILTAFALWGAVYSGEGIVLKGLLGVTAVVAFLQAMFQLFHLQPEDRQ
ncbi:hypothetical protein [Bacillus piscicola]|uniref:hypothetical protein n=1 Tax=Bacillus piscicola TaxID=1632684 RepID=UPI001F09D360|nr:hypothetical protein [Bacillus piscicola]